MVNFSEKLMRDPIALAALAVAKGENLSDALTISARTASAVQEQDERRAQRARQLEFQRRLPELLQMVDVSNPQGSIARLVSAGVPLQQATSLVDTLVDNQRQQASQDQIADFLSGGGMGMTSRKQQEPQSVQDFTPSDADAAVISVFEPEEIDVSALPGTWLIKSGAVMRNPQLTQIGSSMNQAAIANIEARNRARSEFQKEQRQFTRELQKKVEEADVPGLKLIADRPPESTAVKAAREQVQALAEIESAANRLRNFLIEEGATLGMGVTSAQREAGEISNDFLQVMRRISNTGVLNVGEIPVLERGFATFNPANPINVTESREKLIQNLDNFVSRQKIKSREQLRPLGYDFENLGEITLRDGTKTTIEEIRAEAEKRGITEDQLIDRLEKGGLL